MSFRRRAQGCDKQHFENFTYRDGDVEKIETADGLDVRLKLRVLADLLICKLCGGFFREAATIKECLHTFCRSCIVYYYHKGGRVCPLCDERLAGIGIADAIQNDVIIQNLVDKLFPFLGETDEAEAAELNTFLGVVNTTFPQAATTNLKLASSSHISLPATLSAPDLCPSVRASSVSNTSRLVGAPIHNHGAHCPSTHFSTAASDRNGVPTRGSGCDATAEFYSLLGQGCLSIDNFIMKLKLEPLCPILPNLRRPYLRTSPKLHVAHVSRYVSAKLRISDSDAEHMELYYQGQTLPRTHSLEFVCRSRRLDPLQGIYTFRFGMTIDNFVPLARHESETPERYHP